MGVMEELNALCGRTLLEVRRFSYHPGERDHSFLQWEKQGVGGDGREGSEEVEKRGRGGGLEYVDH